MDIRSGDIEIQMEAGQAKMPGKHMTDEIRINKEKDHIKVHE